MKKTGHVESDLEERGGHMERTKLVAARSSKGWSQEEAAEHIGVTRNTLSQWERGKSNPYPIHIHRLCEIYGKTVAELDLESISSEKVQGETEETAKKTPVEHQKQRVPHAESEDTILHSSALAISQGRSGEMIDRIRPRRQILQDILHTACIAFTLSSPYMPLNSEIRERLEQIITSYLRIDMAALSDLSAITKSYWRLCANTSFDLLSGVLGHFQSVTYLLKEPQPPAVYQQLCSLAGEIAQILGKILFDIREYALSWSYYSFSLKLAQEARNNDLWAVGLGRMCLWLIYCGQPQKALPLILRAQQADMQSARYRSWLAAVEAEIHACLGNYDACIRALDISNTIVTQMPLGDDTYATGFNPSRLAGYEGACFVRLHRPEQALPALQKALDLISSTAVRRRSTLLTDIGTVYAQLADVRNACMYASQALTITAQTKSLSTLQRIDTLRNNLKSWDKMPEIQRLDLQFTETMITLLNAKELV